MRKVLLFLTIAGSYLTGWTQIVSLVPSNAGPDSQATLIFRANEGNGELAGASKVYMHHGVVTDSETGTDWNYVIGNWGADDGVGEMTPVSGEPDTWQITFSPSIREYFKVPDSMNIFRISAVFRSADGNTKGSIAPGDYGWGTVAPNGDFFINLNAGSYITINSPVQSESYLHSGDTVQIEGIASTDVSNMKIYLDEGSGYVEKASVTSGKIIDYSYIATTSVELGIKVTAVINSDTVKAEKIHSIVMLQDANVADLPSGMNYGINYGADDTKATLVLEAPGKKFVYAVGDFTDWKVKPGYQMNVTPDGKLFWLELSNLVPDKEYVFQYWVDGEIKIGDPYADKVADPWNDRDIEQSVYPNLPAYDYTQYGIATVLQTGQAPFAWDAGESTWKRPDVNNLMIYELLVRDFVKNHDYKTITDSLSYIKRLGVNAIELMPVCEFEGNDSWGYNPMYYFAPDKYYGPKDDLKKLIETAHQMNIAVIMDIVLNHAYGNNPMVKLYFNSSTGKPSADNPWFNKNTVGQYAYGYDFNHESPYTQAFVDRVNSYWLTNYHFDGFRFDFTKGFTNYAPGGSVDGFDQSRIDILERMADKIWQTDPKAYVILEHWGVPQEETILGNYGMKMWRNKSYDFVPAVSGNPTGSFAGMDDQTHVAYFDSHDEQRIANTAEVTGASNGSYDIKNTAVAFERLKMGAAFAFLNPGPKMIWQFDELGYDIDINSNGRVGRKPLPWGDGSLNYYDDELRQYIYDAYQSILKVRMDVNPAAMVSGTTDNKLTGDTRRLSYDTPETDMVVIGNFGLSQDTVAPDFAETGTWYDYFSGSQINVTNTTDPISLEAGEWHIYTSKKLSDGEPGVVEVFGSPVTVSPYPFTKSDKITITFDAAKASNGGTSGLAGADKVYMHSGVLFNPDDTALSNVVGNLTDDGVGEMTKVGNDLWEITLTPEDYYSLGASDNILKMGLYFRDASNNNKGFGFRDKMIYLNVISSEPFVTVEPAAFNIDDEITVTFNANYGNRELVGSNKVYMHGGVGTVDTQNPASSAWTHVIGNWGADDGVGELTEVSGKEGFWQIKLVPRTYYGLTDADDVYWLSMVFRNADGTVKGTAAAGDIENGIVAANGDIFIRNQKYNTVTEHTNRNIRIYPNPANDHVCINGIKGTAILNIYNVNGKLLVTKQIYNESSINISNLKPGIYIYRINNENKILNGKLIKF